jgi:hypothetical protein
MDCNEFREQIGADPAELDAAAAEHERACPACAAYAQRLRSSERLIAAALRFDVASVRAPRAAATRPVARRGRVWALAAMVAVAAIALWLGRNLVPNRDPVRLAEIVEQHWYHEPDAWIRTATPVASSVLEAALGADAAIDLARLDVVSYARSCFVNGRWVPHLVVQGEAGPVMVLLLAREPLAQPQPLDLPAERLRGAIVPVGGGSIAILGQDGETLEAVQQAVAEAVEWTI